MKHLLILLLFPISLFAQMIGAATGTVSTQQLGVYSNGTDQAANFAAAIAALPSGATLELERGKTYTIASAISLNKSMTLKGNGAVINFTGTGGAAIVAIASSNVSIDGLTVTHTYASYLSNTKLIGTSGSTNTSFYTNISVTNCNLYSSKAYGIYVAYSRNVLVDKNTIHDVPYCGVGFYSVTDSKITNNIIYDITALGTTSSNAYGITVQQLGSDTVTRNILIENNKIDRVPWEGLDTHGGQYITFSKNEIKDCGVGIAMVGYSGGAPIQNKVINNHIQSTDYASSAISVAGQSVGPIYNTGTIIEGNTMQGQHIRLQYTKACIVKNNTIRESGTSYGVYFSGENLNTTVTGNKIIDVYSSTGANVYAIYFDNNNNTATIDGNSLVSATGSGTNRNKYGFSTAVGSTGCEAYIGDNDFSAAVTEQYRSTGQFASRFTSQRGTAIARVTTSSVYTILQQDKMVIYEYTTGGTSITLPAISALNDKRELIIVNTSGGVLTTSIAMYTTTSTNSTTIAAGAKVHLTYDNAAGKIWRD